MYGKKDIIYFAGYTDGDGCFSITIHKGKFRPAFIINSANSSIVFHLTKIYGGTVHTSEQKINQKLLYIFRKSGNDACKFAKLLFPYLVQRKEECRLFISYFDKISKNERFKIVEELKQQRQVNFISYEDINKLKKISHIEPSEEDYVYMAGFIDAECNFGISKYKPKNKPNYTYKIVFQLNDTKNIMFYWIKERFGGFCCYFKRTSKNRDQITYRLVGKSLYPFLKKIVQFLRFKKPVCEKLIEFYETTLINGGARHTEIFRKSYTQTIAKREEIISEIHNLNKKGL
jgi:hypothetical protein